MDGQTGKAQGCAGTVLALNIVDFQLGRAPQQNKGLFRGSLLLVGMVSSAMRDGLAHVGTATLICAPQLDRCEVCQFP